MSLEAMGLQLRVRWRWWLKHYLTAVVLGCRLTGMEPNPQRLKWWIRRGLVLELRHVRALLAA